MARAEVTVRGKTYSIACADGQTQRLAALSVRLDKRVEVISQAVGDVGEARLLLIASLALLDELELSKGTVRSDDSEKRAASVLLDAAARIEAIAQRAEARGAGVRRHGAAEPE